MIDNNKIQSQIKQWIIKLESQDVSVDTVWEARRFDITLRGGNIETCNLMDKLNKSIINAIELLMSKGEWQ